ncbi:MAG: NAD-dependent epimerase/dehydratase family protein [Bryobacterales bacterium]
MTRSLVIGGTLFLGRALVRRLLERGEQVTLLHRGRSNPFAGQTDEIHCDRNDVAAVKEALAGRAFDVVYDNVYDWQRGTTAAQIEAAATAVAKGLRRYVFVSSVGAYQEGENLSEDAPLVPEDGPDEYSRHKANAERMLFRFHAGTGFPAVTLRPPYIYGPENPFYREAFFWDRLLDDRPVLVPDDGSRKMQFVLADDVVRAAIAAADTDSANGRAYNVCDDQAITQNDLVDALAQAAGRKARKVYVPRQRLVELGGGLFEPPLYFAQHFDMPTISEDNTRARRELGFAPTPFEAGLAQAFAWYQQQKNKQPPDYSWEDKVLGRIWYS